MIKDKSTSSNDIIESNTAAIYFSFIFCISSYCYKIMRSAGIYLIQVEIGNVRHANIPQGDISIILRIGRSSATANFSNSLASNEIYFGSIIQLNVDNTALQTQRCSITLNGNDKKIIGIALISLPKDKSLLQNTYRLTQNEDKRAEVQLKIKIMPLDSLNNQINKNIALQVKSETNLLLQSFRPNDVIKSSDNILPKIYTNVVNKLEPVSINPQSKVKSKISEEFSMAQSDDRKTTKTFKLRQDDKVIQTTSSEIKRYKDEKQAYYQLYQIQKSKNEVASKFISSVIKKIGQKYPSLISIVSQSEGKKTQVDKRTYKSQLSSQAMDSTKIDQLQQANRSLHRQVQQYKKIVEQLKAELARGGHSRIQPVTKPTKPSNNFLFPGIFDFDGNKSSLKQKSTLKQKSNIKVPYSPSTIKEQQQKKPAPDLGNIDFKKWLDLSIGQRDSIQNLLGSLIQTSEQTLEKNEKSIKKLKAGLDKSFVNLINKKQVTKDALINHRKEVNRLFQEVLSY